MSESANDVHEALSKARQMYEARLVNVSIEDEGGHKINGDELLLRVKLGYNNAGRTLAAIKGVGGKRLIYPQPHQARV